MHSAHIRGIGGSNPPPANMKHLEYKPGDLIRSISMVNKEPLDLFYLIRKVTPKKYRLTQLGSMQDGKFHIHERFWKKDELVSCRITNREDRIYLMRHLLGAKWFLDLR